MPARLATICFVMMFLVGISSPAVRADDSAASRATLQGITAVAVVVESLDDDAKKIGLTEEAIRTDVELKLRLAGMRIVTQDDLLTLPGAPYLYVSVTVLPPEAGCISVELNQSAVLRRNGESAFGVTTWSVGSVRVNPSAQGIRNAIKDEVDTFLNAWLSVNPKK